MAMIARQNIKVNLVPGGVPPVLNVSQYDSAYDVHFTIYNGAEVFVIPDDVSVRLEETKRDGYGFTIGATKSEYLPGQCYIWMAEQMTAVAGDQICELALTNEDERRIGTANFILRVEPAALSDDTVISNSQIAYASQVLNQLGSVAAYKEQLDAQGTRLNTLTANVSAEVARASAAEAAEADQRRAADNLLQSQINEIVSPSGDAPSAAEVQNIRVGLDGITYSLAGDAVRSNDELIKETLDLLESDAVEKVALSIPATTANSVMLLNGTVGSKTGYKVTGEINITGYDYIQYPRLYVTEENPNYGAYVSYTSGSSGGGSGEAAVGGVAVQGIVNAIMHVSNMDTLRFTVPSSVTPYCYGYKFKYDAKYSELKDAIVDTNKVLKAETGSAFYEWTPGRIKTDTTTIDITDIDTSDSNPWYHAVIPCAAGDPFHIKVDSATSTARPYAVVNASGSRQAVYGSNAIDADVTMPSHAAYLIVNSRYKPGVVYGGGSRISALETRVEQAYFPKGRLNNYPVDLDNVTDIGTYTILLNDPNTRYVNCPFDDGGMLIVSNGYSAFKTQIGIANSGDVYVRNYTSEWLTWTKINADVSGERFLYENLLGIFLTIGVVGDSLASGQGRINDLNHYHDFYDYSWPQQMARRLGNTVYNFTESSLSTRTWLTDADHGWPLASDGQHNCQAYIIGLGANDIAIATEDSSYIGNISDINVSDYTQNPDTYYGNYGRIISMLKTLEPRAKIFVVTNPAFGTQSIRDQLNAAVAEIAELFDDVYLVLLDETQYNTGFIDANKIKSHYTPAAYLYMANILLNAISKIIYDNPADFFFVNLIGTDYATPDMT